MINSPDYSPKYIWPDIFENEFQIAVRDPRALCADGLMAWALCMCGSAPPKSFEDVLIKIAARLDMRNAPTADNLTEYARQRGWLKQTQE